MYYNNPIVNQLVNNMQTTNQAKIAFVFLELEKNHIQQDFLNQCMEDDLVDTNPVIELKCYDMEDTPTILPRNANQPYFRKFEKKKYK